MPKLMAKSTLFPGLKQAAQRWNLSAAILLTDQLYRTALISQNQMWAQKDLM
jgi:predicted nuclease of restriction endonuclease-like RecB superfamily